MTDELKLKGTIELEVDESDLQSQIDRANRKQDRATESPAATRRAPEPARKQPVPQEGFAQGLAIARAVEKSLSRITIPGLGLAALGGLSRVVGGGRGPQEAAGSAVAASTAERARGGGGGDVLRDAAIFQALRRRQPGAVAVPRPQPAPSGLTRRETELAVQSVVARRIPGTATAGTIGGAALRLSPAMMAGIVGGVATAGVAIAAKLGSDFLTKGVDKRIEKGIGAAASFSGPLSLIEMERQMAERRRAIERGEVVGGPLRALSRQREITRDITGALGSVTSAQLAVLQEETLRIINPFLREIVEAILKTGRFVGLFDADRVDRALDTLGSSGERKLSVPPTAFGSTPYAPGNLGPFLMQPRIGR